MGRRGLVAVGSLLLLGVTVLAFRSFDRGSHSASDTLRPFLLTMGPVWIGAVAAARMLVRRGRDPR
ncbi:MAG TPA: hypothetical protein VMG74_05030 [Gaiellaceae bacterium]|nr:hypothetical protein [Gaiellaceae bacterium]